MRIGKLRVAALLTATACATMMMLAACGEKPAEHTHTLQEVVAVAATCTTAGAEAYYKCTDTTCGKLFSDAEGKTEITAAKVVPAKGHNMTKHEAVTATCTGEGTVEYYTCANEAADVYYADNQGAQKLETISTPKTKHQLVAVPEKKATCAAAGTKAYWNCITCQHKFSDENGEHEIETPEPIPQLKEHSDPVFKFSAETLPKPDEQGGSLDTFCSLCGEKLEPISYKKGFENVAHQPTGTAELNEQGLYYATTYAYFSQAATDQEGGWAYVSKAYIGITVSSVGEYTLSFTDVLPRDGEIRSLNSLWITDGAYGTVEGRSTSLIYNCKPSTKADMKTKLAAFDIEYKDYDESGDTASLKALNSITFNITQDNLDTYGGTEKTLYIKIGIVHWNTQGGSTVVVNDRSVPFLVDFSKE